MPEALPQDNLDDAFFKAGTSFKRAIPGQSLTGDPETPMPSERPPKFTNRKDALEYYFEFFTEEENYLALMNTIQEDIPLMEIVQVFLIQGFQEGLYNPDMVMLLAEPLTYMIAALAERADIDFTIMGEEDEYADDKDDDDDDEESKKEASPTMREALARAQNPEIDEDFPPDLIAKINNVKPPAVSKKSLLGER